MMKKLYISGLFLLIATQKTTAQVLFSESFDSHTIGALSNDLTGQTQGKGGWYVHELNDGTAIIMSESGKANVIGLGKTVGQTPAAQISMKQNNINILWDSRSTGNEIFLLE